MVEIPLNTYEILNITVNVFTLILILFQLISSHHGDCRGAVLSQIKTPDGNFVTRQAKLSFHDNYSDKNHQELQSLT